MTDLDHVVFAGVEGDGVQHVAASFKLDDHAGWSGWEGKLKLYARLLSESAAARPPAESFTHIVFPDNTAALLRRFARTGDVGRNTAHALVGPSELINTLLPVLSCWRGWYDDAPQSMKLDPVPLTAFDPAERSTVDVSALVPILATALEHPRSTYSVIGFPADPRQRLAAMLLLREVMPARDWTFSTHEMNDADKENLPKLIFLSAPPSGQQPAQHGRIRIDLNGKAATGSAWVSAATRLLTRAQPAQDDEVIPVAEEVPDTEREQHSEPDTEVARAPVTEKLTAMPPVRVSTSTTKPVRPPAHRSVRPLDLGRRKELREVLYGGGRVTPRLVRLTQLVKEIDPQLLREEAAHAVAVLEVPQQLATCLVEHLDEQHYDGLDRAIAVRWRAEQQMPPAEQEAEDHTDDAPAPDRVLANDVWSKQAAWSTVAGRAKRWAQICRWFVLLTLIAGAVGAVLAAQLAAVDVYLMRVTAMLAAMAVLAGTVVRSVAEPHLTAAWTKARQLSEGLKAEVYRYLAGADPYRGSDARQVLIDRTFRSTPPKVKARNGELPRFTDVTSYVADRIDGQIDHHEQRAVTYQRALGRASWIGIYLALFSAVISFVGLFAGENLVVWAGVCTAVTAAITSYVTQAGYEHLTARYLRTADELRGLRRHLPDPGDALACNEFVASCEHVLQQQNKDWLAHLRPAGRGRS
jgi:hypothetical protein